MKLRKDEGSTFLQGIIMLLIFTVAIIVMAYIQMMNLTSVIKTQLEGDLSTANLSAATIDLKNYMETGRLTFVDIRDVYDDFILTFTTNMGLEEKDNNSFLPKSKTYFDGIIKNVTILHFIIYNVEGSETTQITYDVDSRSADTEIYKDSEISTPDGYVITNPTVYSKVEVTLTLPGKITQTVTRENSVAVDVYN